MSRGCTTSPASPRHSSPEPARAGAAVMDAGPLPEAVLGVGRSVTGRRWVWREADARTAMAIAQRAELPELVGRLLAARGVGIDAVTDFLEPTLRVLLPDPSVLRDMDVAAARLASAVREGETVA